MSFFVYILKCNDDTYYTGYTTDLEKRVRDHNGEGTGIGARYTRGRRPVMLVYSEPYATKSEAMKREAAIKKLSRGEKEKLFI